MIDSDSLTILGAGGIALKYGGQELILKVFGPTADRLGKSMAQWASFGADRVTETVIRAAHLLGPRLEEPGSIPPRVALCVYQQAYSGADEVTTEYLAGVLASSRTAKGLDDRGVVYANIIGAMSHYDLLLHYLCYHAIFNNYKARPIDYGLPEHRDSMESIALLGEIRAITNWPADQMAELVAGALTSWSRLGLCDHWMLGNLVTDSGLEGPGLKFTPSIGGFDLFRWGSGRVLGRGKDAFSEGQEDSRLLDLKTLSLHEFKEWTGATTEGQYGPVK